MRSLLLGLSLCFVLLSCKSDSKNTTDDIPNEELGIAQKIANAHGFKNWDSIEEIKFTFKVDRDTIKGNGRSWTWRPQDNTVRMVAGEQDISYNGSNTNSIPLNVDRAFINDKYWLMVPFQLVWDDTAKISEPRKAEAPISKTNMDVITITYPSEGGYTPGDAYDIYYGDDYLIKEWSFRKGNSPEPQLSNTFENYQDFNGIKIAIDHKKDEGKWNLNFADVSVK